VCLYLHVFSAHLPGGYQAGAWVHYVRSTGAGGAGLGTIGYNHGYVAAQVLLLVSLRIHLSSGQKAFSDGILLFVSIIACFLSGSRAGMAASLVFAVALWAKKPIYTLIVVVLLSVAAITVPADWLANLDPIMERQLTLTKAYEPQNWSGRVDIWVDRLAFLNENPVRWIIGSGFGSAVESGSNAHMLYFHIILETGLIGLSTFLLLGHKVLQYLRRHESSAQPILWITVALLVSSLTQETFYPDTSMGQFLGFYLCSLAVALRS